MTLTHTDYSRNTLRHDVTRQHAGWGRRMSADLFEQFFGGDSEAIGDLGRAVEHFQDVAAERATKFADGSRSRSQFDPAESGIAFGADDVAFPHARIMPPVLERSKTTSAG
jgi:hypothetical protein